MASKRPSKDENYLEQARIVAQRGTCIRRNFGAVIVRDGIAVSSGYTGAPRGEPNCIDLARCIRNERNIPSGERYELCRSVHAEANAIINAARSGVSVLSGMLYLYGENPDGTIVEGKPCKMCKRWIINAGIEEVVIKTLAGMRKYNVLDWVLEANRNPFAEIEEKGY